MSRINVGIIAQITHVLLIISISLHLFLRCSQTAHTVAQTSIVALVSRRRRRMNLGLLTTLLWLNSAAILIHIWYKVTKSIKLFNFTYFISVWITFTVLVLMICPLNCWFNQLFLILLLNLILCIICNKWNPHCSSLKMFTTVTIKWNVLKLRILLEPILLDLLLMLLKWIIELWIVNPNCNSWDSKSSTGSCRRTV